MIDLKVLKMSSGGLQIGELQIGGLQIGELQIGGFCIVEEGLLPTRFPRLVAW